MFCPKCGKELLEDSKFCAHCGAEIGEQSQNEQKPIDEEKNTIGAVTSVMQGKATAPQKTKKWVLLGGLALIAVVLLVVLISGGNRSEDKTGGESGDKVEETSGGDKIIAAADFYKWIAETDEFDYSIPEKSISFINENPQFFPGNEKNTGAMSDFVDYDIDFPHVAKSPTKYADKLMWVSGTVIDCEEVETEHGVMTYLHIMDDYSGNSYCLYYLGALDDVFEDTSVWGYALPFGVTTFENMSAAYTEAIIGAACYIEGDSFYGYEE